MFNVYVTACVDCRHVFIPSIFYKVLLRMIFPRIRNKYYNQYQIYFPVLLICSTRYFDFMLAQWLEVFDYLHSPKQQAPFSFISHRKRDALYTFHYALTGSNVSPLYREDNPIKQHGFWPSDISIKFANWSCCIGGLYVFGRDKNFFNQIISKPNSFDIQIQKLQLKLLSK